MRNVMRIGEVVAFARSLQPPWCTTGDLNMDIHTMANFQFLQKIGGHILSSSVECTCMGGSGNSRLDYIIAGAACA
eukprot:5336811-Pyramimonas_sp.AAC.1